MAKSAIERAREKFEEDFVKAFGTGSIERTGEIAPYEVISTGSIALDYATTVGGLVEGRLHEYWGVDGIGKTTMALQAVREAQIKHPDKMTAWIDMENRLDKPWAATHGIDLTRLWIAPTENAEEVADKMKSYVTSGLVSLVVLDSIGAMIPEVEKQKDAGDAVVGTAAQRVTRMVTIAAPEAKKSGTCVILINQVRANLSGFGKATTTGGGWALRHGTTMKMEFKRTGQGDYKATIDGVEEIVGQQIAIKVERNSVGPRGRQATIDLFNQETERYGPIGIDQASEAFDIALTVRPPVLERRGGWVTIDGEDINGRDAAIEHLRKRPDLVAELRAKIIATRKGEVLQEEDS